MREQGGAEDVERRKGRRGVCLNLDVLSCQKNTQRLEQNHSITHPSFSSRIRSTHLVGAVIVLLRALATGYEIDSQSFPLMSRTWL